MTLTLFDLTYKVGRELGPVVEGKATGGTATTIIDTVERTEPDDFWNVGTAWILRDAGGLGAAPEKEYAVVLDFAQSTSTLTLRDALTVAVAAGDKYALAKRRYPLSILIQKVNEALQAMGTVPVDDITTIPSLDAGQSEYSLPIAAGMDLREVYYSLRAQADFHDWIKSFDWDIRESPTGTADRLVLTGPYFMTGTPVRLVYMDLHPELHLATDKLKESVHPDRVVTEAAYRAALWRDQKIGGDDPTIQTTLVRLQPERETADERHPIQAPAATSKLLIAKRRDRRYPGDQNPR